MEKLHASRSCGREIVEIGESVDVEVNVTNSGTLTVPWLLL